MNQKINTELTKITSAIIANQIAFNFNHEIKFTPYFKQNLKRLYSQINKELEKAEKTELQKYEDVNSDAVEQLLELQSDIVNEISKIGLVNFGPLLNLIQCYSDEPEKFNNLIKQINEGN